MSQKTVLSIGQCRPDSAAIAYLLQSGFSAKVVTADLADEALRLIAAQPFDLVLINRVLDADGSDGMEILRSMRQQAAYAAVPVMLVSNYAEWQTKAVATGALPGFGKAELNRPETREKLAAVLS